MRALVLTPDFNMSLKYAINIFAITDLRTYVSQILHQYYFRVRALVLTPDSNMSLKYAINIFAITDLRTYVSQILHQHYFHMRGLFLSPDLLYVSQILSPHIH